MSDGLGEAGRTLQRRGHGGSTVKQEGNLGTRRQKPYFAVPTVSCQDLAHCRNCYFYSKLLFWQKVENLIGDSRESLPHIQSSPSQPTVLTARVVNAGWKSQTALRMIQALIIMRKKLSKHKGGFVVLFPDGCSSEAAPEGSFL